MSNDNYKEIWQSKFKKEKHDWEEVWEMDPYENWENDDQPDLTAQWNLISGLRILYADLRSSLGFRFIQRASEIVARSISERKFESDLCENLYPLNIACGLRVKFYATAILLGKIISDVDLLESAKYYVDWANKHMMKSWDDKDQAYYLNAIRIFLILGDHLKANELLKINKTFKLHATEYNLLLKISEDKSIYPIDNKELSREYDVLFNTIRNPTFKPTVFMETDIVRFELGVIKYKYFISANGEIDWLEAINLVSR